MVHRNPQVDLEQAIAACDVGAGQDALAGGADPNAPNAAGVPPLWQLWTHRTGACDVDDRDALLRALLAAGAQAHAEWPHAGIPGMPWAGCVLHAAIADSLAPGQPPIAPALIPCHLAPVTALLDRGARPAWRDAHGHDSLNCWVTAVQRHPTVDPALAWSLAERLLAYGASPNAWQDYPASAPLAERIWPWALALAHEAPRRPPPASPPSHRRAGRRGPT
jgi:hypothetical protein